MKLIETLTNQQKIDLLSGDAVGIFPYLILPEDAYHDKIYEMCLGYYMSHSGEKTISPAYDKIISITSLNDVIVQPAEQILANIIRGKFSEKWSRVYSALIETEYDILKNKENVEKKIGQNKDQTTYDISNVKVGTNSDTVTYNSDTTDEGNTGTHEKTTRKSDSSDNVYGFNSSLPVGDSTSEDITEETVEGDFAKNTSFNRREKRGADDHEINLNETDSKTGTDTKDFTIDETVTDGGRDGTGADLILSELNLRNTQIFFDIIYADIDSVATLQL